MIDRHFKTYDKKGAPFRSTGGTSLPAAPRDGPRNYFEDFSGGTDKNPVVRATNGVRYHDSADWWRPGMNRDCGNSRNISIGSCFTGNYEETNTAQPSARWYNYGEPTKQSPKAQPFACEPLSALSNSLMESTVTDLGSANVCLDQMTFKIFNNKIIPGYILHGIVYFSVSADVKINKITLSGICNVHKQIDGKNRSTSDTQVYSFKKEIITNATAGNRRKPSQYQALTQVWNGDHLMEALQLPVDCFPADDLEWPFEGPITLPKGTHAIPLAIRIPFEVNPTLTYTKHGAKRDQKATVSHTTSVSVEVNAQPVSGGTLLTVLSDRLDLDMQSCGDLPPVVGGVYGPGCVQLISLGYRESSALIIMEKKHFLPGDVIRIFVYTNNKNAVRNAFAELIVAYNLPEIGLLDNGDVMTAKQRPGIELLDRCSKKRLSTKFNKVFTSRVGDEYPETSTSNIPTGRLRSTMDEKRLMPESTRVNGVLLELKVPKDVDPSIEAGESRIRHHVRVHFNVRHQRKPTSQAQIVTVANELVHNYVIKYVKFVN